MKSKKKTSRAQFINIKCAKCGKVTRHSLTPNGDYRCIICGNSDKHVNIPVKNVTKVHIPTQSIDPTTDYIGSVSKDILSDALIGSASI